MGSVSTLLREIEINFFLLVTIIAFHGAIWGGITTSVVEKRGSNEKWFWWGFFFGPLACAVASLTFKPLSELEIVQLFREYQLLFDDGMISSEELEEKRRLLFKQNKRKVSTQKSER